MRFAIDGVELGVSFSYEPAVLIGSSYTLVPVPADVTAAGKEAVIAYKKNWINKRPKEQQTRVTTCAITLYDSPGAIAGKVIATASTFKHANDNDCKFTARKITLGRILRRAQAVDNPNKQLWAWYNPETSAGAGFVVRIRKAIWEEFFRHESAHRYMSLHSRHNQLRKAYAELSAKYDTLKLQSRMCSSRHCVQA